VSSTPCKNSSQVTDVSEKSYPNSNKAMKMQQNIQDRALSNPDNTVVLQAQVPVRLFILTY